MGFWDYVSAFGNNAYQFGNGAAFGALYGVGAKDSQAEWWGLDTSNQWAKGGFETGAMFNMGLGSFAGPMGKIVASGMSKGASWLTPDPEQPLSTGDPNAFNDPMQNAAGGWYSPDYGSPSYYGGFGTNENGWDTSGGGTNYGSMAGYGNFATNDSGYASGFSGTSYTMPGGSPYGDLSGSYNSFGGSDPYGSYNFADSYSLQNNFESSSTPSWDGGASSSYGSFGTNMNGWDTSSSGTSYGWDGGGGSMGWGDFGAGETGGGDWGSDMDFGGWV